MKAKLNALIKAISSNDEFAASCIVTQLMNSGMTQDEIVSLITEDNTNESQ
jgi:hypothetical protein